MKSRRIGSISTFFPGVHFAVSPMNPHLGSWFFGFRGQNLHPHGDVVCADGVYAAWSFAMRKF
jgi:hypothetical protein